MSMAKVALSVLIVLFFYNFIAAGDGGTTDLTDLRHKSYSAAALGVIMLTISYKWWASMIAAIEGILLLVNLHVAYHWDTASIFDAYYPQIQLYACVLEILILCVAIIEVATNGGRSGFNSYFNHGKHRYFMRSGGSKT